MAAEMNVSNFLANGVAPALRSNGRSPTRGLLLIADEALARAFRRELRRCADCAVSLDCRPTFQEARQANGGPYHWVAVDLDGAIAPAEAVRLARRAWPTARVAVLSLCWSERDAIARDLADVVIHKPLRSPELLAFLRAAGASEPEAVPAATGARTA